MVGDSQNRQLDHDKLIDLHPEIANGWTRESLQQMKDFFCGTGRGNRTYRGRSSRPTRKRTSNHHGPPYRLNCHHRRLGSTKPSSAALRDEIDKTFPLWRAPRGATAGGTMTQLIPKHRPVRCCAEGGISAKAPADPPLRRRPRRCRCRSDQTTARRDAHRTIRGA